jgi:hypothetical protein
MNLRNIYTSLLLTCLYAHAYAQGCFPPEKLPSHITALTSFGQRAEWSIDGKNVYFLDKPGGEVWVVNVKTKATKQVTKPKNREKGYGYYRVMCLANGDLLLCGGFERHRLFFEVLDKSLQKAPQKIANEELDEGPAISRKTMKIAWTSPGQKQIYEGKISYKNGVVTIINKKLLVDSKNVVSDEGIKYEDILESQNWRGKNEQELIFAQYKGGRSFRSEVFGIETVTGKIINYSKDSLAYDEPEGIFPDGKYTLVESDKHNITSGTSTIDIYKLKLDGTGKNYERLTFFSDIKGYRSSNPMMSDDARFMVFQGSYSGSEAGGGCGIYLFDFKKFKNKK